MLWKSRDYDFYKKGIEYKVGTYTNHPKYFPTGGAPLDLNVGKGDDDLGMELYSPTNGKVVVATYDNGLKTGWGNSIVWSGNGSEIHLAHLQRFGKLGNVKAGDVIGYVGDTGKSSSPHLHIQNKNGQLKLSGVFISPNGEYVSDGQKPKPIIPIISLLLDDSKRGDTIKLSELPSLPYTHTNGTTYSHRIVYQAFGALNGARTYGATYLTAPDQQWVTCPGATAGTGSITVYGPYEKRLLYLYSEDTGVWNLDTTNSAFRSPYFDINLAVPLYDLTFDVIYNGFFNGFEIPWWGADPCEINGNTHQLGETLFTPEDVIE